jgi:hypothetical protein
MATAMARVLVETPPPSPPPLLLLSLLLLRSSLVLSPVALVVEPVVAALEADAVKVLVLDAWSWLSFPLEVAALDVWSCSSPPSLVSIYCRQHSKIYPPQEKQARTSPTGRP